MQYNTILLLFAGTLLSTSCLAETTYFLCGPDEDGCFEQDDYYRFCTCIPQDPITFSHPYCLDWDKMACISTDKDPCQNGVTFKTQSDCVSTLYQSEPRPPCPLKTRFFCEENHIHMCDSTSNAAACAAQH